jgi:hypothetical protein
VFLMFHTQIFFLSDKQAIVHPILYQMTTQIE